MHIEDCHEAIIDKAEWERVQEIPMQELMKLLHDVDKSEGDIQTFINWIRAYGIGFIIKLMNIC